MACVGDSVVCVAGKAGTSAMVGGVAVAADERPDIVSNRAAEATAVDSVAVSGVLMEGEDGCRHACNRFSNVAVVKATPLVGGAVGPRHPLAA